MHIFDKILVIVFVLQTITFITSTSTKENDLLHETPNNNKTNITTTNNGTTAVKNNNHNVLPKDQSILTESGGSVAAISAVPKSHNREHAINETLVTNANKIVRTSSTSTQKPDLHVNSSSTAPLSLPDVDKPSHLNNKTSEHKKISARKGVNFTDVEIKKPTITTASEDEPYAPSHFQSSSKINSSAAQSIPKVPNLEMLSNSNQNTQKYVVPIVIVILSVPFVAILISILYKRGAEWWKYRHYRRMDFLINGMYDN